MRQEFVEKEVKARRDEAIETNNKMKRIMKSWMGLSIEDCFFEWKNMVSRQKKQRGKDKRAKNKVEKIEYESELARLDYARKEVRYAD